MKRKLIQLILSMSLLLSAIGSAPHVQSARQQPSERQNEKRTNGLLHLQAGTFDPLHEAPQLMGQFTTGAWGSEDATTNQSPHHLVQFQGPVEAAWLSQLEMLGVKVLGYVPDNAHLVRLPIWNTESERQSVIEQIRSLPSVRWVGPYRPQYKVAPQLAQQAIGTQSVQMETMTILGFPGDSVDLLEQALRNANVQIDQMTQTDLGPVAQVQIASQRLPEIATLPAVNWIEPYTEPQLFNAEGRKILAAETLWQDHGYYGNGQIIAVSDTGLSDQRNLSRDFAGRLRRAFAPSEMNISPLCQTATSWTDRDGHGTHVAGSLLGNGLQSGSDPANHNYAGSHAGSAPEAELVFLALSANGGLECIDANGDYIAKGYDEGARISSNSWGRDDRGGYTQNSMIVDHYVWNHKDYLVLYAAGNQGPGAQTVGSPATAKNILSVGASENLRPDLQHELADNPDSMAIFSSRGPTQDGRIKPDVVAPGSFILSKRAPNLPDNHFNAPFNDEYAYMNGTSMATPLAAGGAALVREWLQKARNIENPSAALMKAAMINGAFGLPNRSIPNIDSGWGRVDLKNTLEAQYVIFDDHVQGIATGETVTYSIEILGTNRLGTLFATPETTSQMALSTASPQDLGLRIGPAQTVPNLQQDQTQVDPNHLQVVPLPGHAVARAMTPIPSAAGSEKESNRAISNPVPTEVLSSPTLQWNGTPSAHFHPAQEGGTQLHSYQQNMVGGGDFEDPDWSLIWQYVWLGAGVPERTNIPGTVINGFYSMWLGGTPVADSIWYPVRFPDAIDTSLASGIAFNVGIVNQDVASPNTGDAFCAAPA
ncbi:S8 family serine peptidase [Chloroflexi bacterium TSY]|nr:S8 family serine peptidase [Chloroflexi bacterium TSY]